MGVKKDFKKACKLFWDEAGLGTNTDDFVLWAAKWMAERCATELEKSESYRDIVESKICADDIRKLAKELS